MLKSVRAKVVSRVLGATALAVAIAAGPIAGPASAAELNQFAGTGTGYALRVTLDLRGSLLEPILSPVLGPVVEAVSGKPFTGVIDQYFIKTSSEADASNTKARSALAEGLLNLDVVEATNVGETVEKTVQNIALPSEDLDIISGTIGNLLAKVVGGPNVGSSGELDNLGVGLPLDGLPEGVLDDLLEQLNAVLEDLVGEGGTVTTLLDDLLGGAELEGLVDQVTGAIDGLTGQVGLGGLGDLAGGLGLPVDDLVNNPTAVTEAVTDLLEDLLDTIRGILEDNLLTGNLAELQGLVNLTGAQKSENGTKAVADSLASLQSLEVLGGLVDVDLLNIASRSFATGQSGGAGNTSDCSILDASIGGGALDISLDGSSISIGGQEIPLPIAEIKALVDGLLNALGIDVGLCEAADVQVDPAGRSASQSVSALRVELAPLGLFKLIIDPTVQTAVAAQVGTPNESTSTPDSPNPTLPRTGAGMAVSIFGGLGLALAAIMIRRRFV
jgi:hypothetical protein